MKLAEKLGMIEESQPAASRRQVENVVDASTFDKVKSMVHAHLVDVIDLDAIDDTPRDILEGWIKDAIREVTEKQGVPLNSREQDQIVSDVVYEILGLGPIEPLIQDDSVTDLLVNTYRQVFVERKGRLEQTPVRFRDNEHLMQIIDRIVSAVGRRIDESSPMVDARLADGSRVNAIIPPLALDGPILSIRKFGNSPLTLDSLLAGESITPEIIAFLEGAVKAKLNILISGGTGSGKTTLLNSMSRFIPDNERIITIEDSAELLLQQPHVVRLESRPSNVEGRGQVALRDLVKNSLRMRPDRIIVGEVRGAEALDMLQAMNTGHPGSMSTVHANTPRDAFSRLEVMVQMGAMNLSERALRALTASAINVIIQLSRLPDGKRRMISLSEVTGTEQGNIVMQDIFVFDQYGVDNRGNILGAFKGTGITPFYLDLIERSGQSIDRRIFSITREVGKGEKWIA